MRKLVRRVHDTDTRLVLAISGGGTRAAAELLEVPGASRTVLEAVVPYSSGAMADWLSGWPDQFCSAAAARAMAMAAFLRANVLETEGHPTAGIACTASLASDRPKRGEHRAHLALQSEAQTLTRSVELAKGRRSRAQEEAVVAGLVLNLVATACGLEDRVAIDLLPDETIDESKTAAPQPWRDLLMGRSETVRIGASGPDDSPPGAVFPGAFNPLHAGHRRMAEIARERLGLPVEFEISILNVDKPPLDYHEIERRLGQFDAGRTVWLTRAATFVEKSALFPGVTFIVGADTLQRVAEPRYYNDDPAACRRALEQIAAGGNRFLVFGRLTPGGFLTLSDLDLPAPLATICEEVPAEEFRDDVSSTEIRKSGEA